MVPCGLFNDICWIGVNLEVLMEKVRTLFKTFQFKLSALTFLEFCFEGLKT